MDTDPVNLEALLELEEFLTTAAATNTSPSKSEEASKLKPKRPPPRRRNLDKRRDLAKLAARSRRNVESELYEDLGRAVALQAPPKLKSKQKQIDNLGILRLAVTNLRLRALFAGGSHERLRHDEEGSHSIALLPQTPLIEYDLDELLHGGFLIVLSTTGDILYVSGAVSQCVELGLDSCELVGTNVYEYVNPGDWSDLLRLLNMDFSEIESQPQPRSGLVRFTNTKTEKVTKKKSPRQRQNSSGSVGVYFTGNVYPSGAIIAGHPLLSPCFIGVGRSIPRALPHPHPADNDYPYLFVSRRIFTSLRPIDNLNFNLTADNVEHLLRFTPSEIASLKWFELLHAEDARMVQEKVKEVHQKGQTHSEPYRLLAKGGGWVWVIAEASTVFMGSLNSQTPTAVLTRYFAISGIETNEILSLAQIPEVTSLPQVGVLDPFSESGDWDDDGDEELFLETLAKDVNLDLTTLPAFIEALDSLLSDCEQDSDNISNYNYGFL